MTKSDLEDVLFFGLGLSRPDAQQGVRLLLSHITSALRQGDEVKINGFGVFEVRERAARMGRNPRTNEPVSIPATRIVGFRAADTLLNPVKADMVSALKGASDEDDEG